MITSAMTNFILRVIALVFVAAFTPTASGALHHLV
jgi:hypothetical protein